MRRLGGGGLTVENENGRREATRWKVTLEAGAGHRLESGWGQPEIRLEGLEREG